MCCDTRTATKIELGLPLVLWNLIMAPVLRNPKLTKFFTFLTSMKNAGR